MRKWTRYANTRKILALFVVVVLLVVLISYRRGEHNDHITISGQQHTVLLCRCVDGDTAVFQQDNQEITVRFLAIDTPEIAHEDQVAEAYGPEAAQYTCDKLKGANEIVLEYDAKADKDVYDRQLAWVWVDQNLLQMQLVSEGLAKVAYIYDDYLYVNQLKKAQKDAQRKKVGIWQGE